MSINLGTYKQPIQVNIQPTLSTQPKTESNALLYAVATISNNPYDSHQMAKQHSKNHTALASRTTAPKTTSAKVLGNLDYQSGVAFQRYASNAKLIIEQPRSQSQMILPSYQSPQRTNEIVIPDQIPVVNYNSKFESEMNVIRQQNYQLQKKFSSSLASLRDQASAMREQSNKINLDMFANKRSQALTWLPQTKQMLQQNKVSQSDYAITQPNLPLNSLFGRKEASSSRQRLDIQPFITPPLIQKVSTQFVTREESLKQFINPHDYLPKINSEYPGSISSNNLNNSYLPRKMHNRTNNVDIGDIEQINSRMESDIQSLSNQTKMLVEREKQALENNVKQYMPSQQYPPPKFEQMDDSYQQAQPQGYQGLTLSQQLIDSANLGNMRTAYERDLTNFAKKSNAQTAIQANNLIKERPYAVTSNITLKNHQKLLAQLNQ